MSRYERMVKIQDETRQNVFALLNEADFDIKDGDTIEIKNQYEIADKVAQYVSGKILSHEASDEDTPCSPA